MNCRISIVLFSLSLSSILLLSLPQSVAQSASPPNRVYVPPPNSQQVQQTEAGGNRGCQQIQSLSLLLLVPPDHIGQTVESHPTFLWYISKDFLRIRFTLVEPMVTQPIFVKEIISKKGIMGLKLPNNIPELEKEKNYRWTITVICHPTKPSLNLYARALFKRVDLLPSLAQKLSQANSAQGKSRVFAEAKKWYEAISSLVIQDLANQKILVINPDFEVLLQQIGINLTISSDAKH
jgi:hypothetical protein